MKMYRLYGRTLIELMVSMLLGLFLLGQLVYIYANQKATYTVQTGLNRIVENANFLTYIISKDVRMAGLQGCDGVATFEANNIVTSPPNDAVFTTSDVITGYEATTSSSWSPALPTALAGNVIGGTDVLTVRQASPQSVFLSNPLGSASDVLTIPNRVSFAPGDIVLITDCQDADIFQASTGTTSTNITHSTLNNDSANLSKNYSTTAKVAKFESYTYYIQDTGRNNLTGQDIFGLFRMDINGNSIELAEGVEDMELTYGVDTDTDGTVDSYMTADTVASGNNWPNVVSIRINLLLNTINEVNHKPQPYTFDSAIITPTNNMLHRERSIYIALRNRTL